MSNEVPTRPPLGLDERHAKVARRDSRRRRGSARSRRRASARRPPPSCANCCSTRVVLVAEADRVGERARRRAAVGRPTSQNGQSRGVRGSPAAQRRGRASGVCGSSLASSPGSMLIVDRGEVLAQRETDAPSPPWPGRRAPGRTASGSGGSPASPPPACPWPSSDRRAPPARRRRRVNVRPGGTRSPRCSMTSMSCSAASGCSLPCGKTTCGLRRARRARADAASSAAAPQRATIVAPRASLGRSRRAARRAGRPRPSPARSGCARCPCCDRPSRSRSGARRARPSSRPGGCRPRTGPGRRCRSPCLPSSADACHAGRVPRPSPSRGAGSTTAHEIASAKTISETTPTRDHLAVSRSRPRTCVRGVRRCGLWRAAHGCLYRSDSAR